MEGIADAFSCCNLAFSPRVPATEEDLEAPEIWFFDVGPSFENPGTTVTRCTVLGSINTCPASQADRPWALDYGIDATEPRGVVGNARCGQGIVGRELEPVDGEGGTLRSSSASPQGINVVM